MIDLNRLIEQAYELAPLPASTVRLAEVIDRDDCSLEQVAELIAFDQALTIKLLRAANSAAEAGTVTASTVEEAVALMGTAQVLAFAVACGVKPVLQSRVAAYGLEEGRLWRHSVASAAVAEMAPGFCGVEIPREAFTSALLHDVGKLIMGRFLSLEILGFLRRAQEVDHLEPLEAESQVLGVNHGELGGLIAQHWRLPDQIIQGITFHHNPDQGLESICDVTYLSDQVAKSIEAELDGHPCEPIVLSTVSARLGLDSSSLNALQARAAERFAQISLRYNSI